MSNFSYGVFLGFFIMQCLVVVTVLVRFGKKKAVDYGVCNFIISLIFAIIYGLAIYKI